MYMKRERGRVRQTDRQIVEGREREREGGGRVRKGERKKCVSSIITYIVERKAYMCMGRQEFVE